MDRLAASKFWDRRSASFDAVYSGDKSWLSRWLDRRFRRDIYLRFDWVLRQAGDLRGKTVCDLGCGSGRYVVALAEQGADKVVGLDISAGMLERAGTLVQAAGVQERCELRRQDILECDDAPYDLTLAMGVFDYVEDPLPYLERIRTLTAGKFVASFPRARTWRRPLRKLRLALQGCPVYFYREDQVRSLLAQSGFDCGEIAVVGTLYCAAATSLRSAPPTSASSARHPSSLPR